MQRLFPTISATTLFLLLSLSLLFTTVSTHAVSNPLSTLRIHGAPHQRTFVDALKERANADPKFLENVLAQFHAAFPDHKWQAGLLGDALANDRLLHQWAITNVTCQRQKICNSFDSSLCEEVCKEGTVAVDPWLANALATQRQLQLDVPLNYWSLPGTHNSAITKANGYGLSEGLLNEMLHVFDKNWMVWIANQQLALEDQFNLGVRNFELDVHWYDGFIRICHAGGIHLAELDNFIAWLSKEIHYPIDWDSETIGCFSPRDRHVNTTFAEIRTFLTKPQNAKEFAIFYFDDEEDLQVWNKVELLLQGIEYHFGSSVFTPTDKAKLFPNRWPTTRELQGLSKQLMFVSRTNFSNDMGGILFSRDQLWTEFGPHDNFKPFPTCTIGRNFPIGTGPISRLLGDSLAYGPFWQGYSGGSLIMPDDIDQEEACGVNFVCTDQMSPVLSNSFVWSWRQGEPSLQNGCASIGTDGRWATVPCDTKLPAACQSTTNANDWRLSSSAGAWNGTQSCGAGYAFSVPRNGLANNMLAAAAKGASAWLAYSP